MSWTPPSPQLLDRLRVFVLTGYTGPTRLATLLTQEAWPTPADVKYNKGKARSRWMKSTVSGMLEQLTFQDELQLDFPRPAHLTHNAMRRVLRFFDRRPPRPGELGLYNWLEELKAELPQPRKRPTSPTAQATHLFDPI